MLVSAISGGSCERCGAACGHCRVTPASAAHGADDMQRGDQHIPASLSEFARGPKTSRGNTACISPISFISTDSASLGVPPRASLGLRNVMGMRLRHLRI